MFYHSRWRSPPSWISEILLADGSKGLDASPCQISSKSVSLLRSYCNFSVCQDDGRPPFWIRLGHIWTTHEGYLVVFITVQNLIAIDAVVSKIWKFDFFARLAWRRLFASQKLFFWNLTSLNGQQYQQNPKRQTLAWVRVVWAIKRENLPTVLTCRWVPEKKV